MAENSPSQERFFILGCQRTGTTLMRLILETHPDVFCYDETRSYGVLQGSIAEDSPHVRLIGFKIPRWTEQLTRPFLFDYGLEGRCAGFYRGERLLFLLRDVHDTIASMLQTRAGESTWGKVWIPRVIKGKLANEDAFRKRYALELDVAQGCARPLVGLAALYWKYKTESFFEYRDDGLPVLGVSYEQLVMQPRDTLGAVCAHLALSFHENLLRHNEFAHAELFEGGLTVGYNDPNKPIRANSLGRWHGCLTEGDLGVIATICGDLPARVAALPRTDSRSARRAGS